jgi:hypothetical protein
MRRAFKDFLPPGVLHRRSKAAYTHVYRQALLPLATEMLSQPAQMRLVAHDYVDGRSITERLSRFVQGLDCHEPQLRQLLLFEFWLRSRERLANSPDAPLTSTLAAFGNCESKPELATRA